jgi:hypothetical protein
MGNMLIEQRREIKMSLEPQTPCRRCAVWHPNAFTYPSDLLCEECLDLPQWPQELAMAADEMMLGNLIYEQLLGD